MKKADSDELRSEYRRNDLGPGVRGKYLESFRSGTNLVQLHPDVAKAFSTGRGRERCSQVVHGRSRGAGRLDPKWAALTPCLEQGKYQEVGEPVSLISP